MTSNLSNRDAGEVATFLRMIGIVDQTSSANGKQLQQPWPNSLADGSTLLEVEPEDYDQVLEDLGNTSSIDIEAPKTQGQRDPPYPLVASSVRGHALTNTQKSYLYLLTYLVRTSDSLEIAAAEESSFQNMFREVFDMILLLDNKISVASTNSPVCDDVLKAFEYLTAVKPDIIVGLTPSRINFKGDDDPDLAAKYEDLEAYLLDHPKILYNLNMLSYEPYFPYFLGELKSLKGIRIEVENQIKCGMFYALNLWVRLRDSAKAADPLRFQTGRSGESLLKVYGITTIGAEWSMWMMSYDPSAKKFLYSKFDYGTTRQLSDAKRLFMHMERIKSESAERNRHAALWLHCLGRPTTGAKDMTSSTWGKDRDRDRDGRDEDEGDDDDHDHDHAPDRAPGRKRRASDSERRGKRGGNDAAGSSTRTRHLALRSRSTIPSPSPSPPPDGMRLVSAWLANAYERTLVPVDVDGAGW